MPIHFVQVRARDPDPLPLVLTHGWPSTFAELLPLVPLLKDPVAHGGQARDAFDVVIPSLHQPLVLRVATRPGPITARSG